MLKGKKLIAYNICCVIITLIVLFFIGIFTKNAFSTEYVRDNFKHWSDLDGDNLDSRQEALLFQSLAIESVHFVTLENNRVVTGLWVCPYTGKVITDPSEIDIDHIVPLKYAWEHGAENWNNIQREMFANDEENLLVVLASVNRSKSDKSPEDWLPPNTSYIETYVSKFWYICDKYKLSCDQTALMEIKNEFTNVKRYKRERPN